MASAAFKYVYIYVPQTAATTLPSLLSDSSILQYVILILIPSVLVPGLDLGVGEVQLGGQLHPVLNGQVLLPLEGALQGLQLLVREGGARFPLLLCVVGVRMPRVVFACIKAAIQYQT